MTWALLACAPAEAHAFTEFTSVTDDCHESMTLAALDRAGWPGGATPPAPTPLDAAVADDLPFPLASARRDPWTVAMLLGVRYPDLAGLDPTDFPAIAELAADPTRQAQHCLRAPGDDGPGGDLAALASCRAHIRAEILAAIGEGDAIDTSAEEELDVWLTFRGDVTLPFRRFAFRLGRALHALQDSFSHTFRDPADARVRAVLNYVDPLHRGYDASRDGHAHLEALDACAAGDPSRERRAAWAIDASADLLAALGDPDDDRAARMARVDAVLDRWLVHVGGCDASNRYCDAPELDERAPSCSARAAGAGRGPTGASLVALGALGLVAARRRRVRGLVPLTLALVLAPALAAAEPPDREVPTDATAERVRDLALEPDVQIVAVDAAEDEATVVTVEERELSGGSAIERGPGLSAGVFGGIDQGVLGVSLGARFDYVSWFIFGIDVEHDAWFSIATRDLALGVFNAAAVGEFVYGKVGIVELRGRIAVGCSVLLFDLAAADKGSVGPFAGFNVLGVAFRATRSVRVVVEPAGLYFAVPQLSGFPLVHRHHRFTVAVQVTP